MGIASVLKVLVTFSMVMDRIACRGGYESWRSVVKDNMEPSSTTGNSANECYQKNSLSVNTELSVDAPSDSSPNSPLVAHPLSPNLGWSVFAHIDVIIIFCKQNIRGERNQKMITFSVLNIDLKHRKSCRVMIRCLTVLHSHHWN